MTAHHAKGSEERAREESRLRRQERKKKQEIAFKTGVWDRCLYQVPGKQRFCAQYRSPHSSEYCATHMEASPSLKKGNRVPCPVDPNHTVFEQQLSSHIKRWPTLLLFSHHRKVQGWGWLGQTNDDRLFLRSTPLAHRSPTVLLLLPLVLLCPRLRGRHICRSVGVERIGLRSKICNVVVREAQMEELPYYSKGINSGSVDKSNGGARGGGNGCASCENRAGETEADVHLDEAFVRDVISRVKAAHRVHVGELRTEVVDPPNVQALHRQDRRQCCASVEGGTGFRKRRHVLQQASIVGHMVKRGLLGPGTSNLYIEMGAGKGALGQAISVACREADITMIERSAVRRKAENRLDETGGGNASRARIDIRDLNMAGLPSLTATGEDRAVVVVAKHLCGAATDLALRALLTLPQKRKVLQERVEESAEDIDPHLPPADASEDIETQFDSGTPRVVGRQRVGGVAIATCCHHACNWRDYTGRRFLEQLGFTSCDFEIMRRVSAWISLEPEAGSRKNNRCEYYREYSRGVSPRSPSPSLSPPGKHPMEKIPGSFVERPPLFSDAGEGGSDSMSNETLTPLVTEGCSRDTSAGDRARDPPTVNSHRQDIRRKSGVTPAAAGFLGEMQGERDSCRSESRIEEHRGLGAIRGLSPTEKAAAARECKRLLDRGRQAFLEWETGLRSEVLHFVEREVTPENALLLGFR